MKSIICSIAIAFFICLTQYAGADTLSEMKPIVVTGEGAISPQLLDNCRCRTIPSEKINAVSGSELKTLAANREVLAKHNTYFSNTIKTVGKVQDQKKSGRCWSFSTLNMLRSALAKKYGLENFELSQNYLLFWDKMEKANYFFELVIASANEDVLQRELKYFLQHPVDDGGHWHYATAVIKKYGVVPKSEMAETVHSENTAVMNDVLKALVRKDAKILRDLVASGAAKDKIRSEKERMLGEVYCVLTMCLGQPPKNISLRYEDKNKKVTDAKMMSPLELYKNAGVELDDYISLINIPNWDYNKTYEIANMNNMVGAPPLKLLNVDIESMKEAVKKSIIAGEPVYFAADVSKDTDKNLGIMSKELYNYSKLLGINLDSNKKDRIDYCDTLAGHAMLLTGVDVQNGRIQKWQVENSWGKTTGAEGFYTMYDDWFEDNIFQAIVNKKYLTENELKIFATTPVVIPEFDVLK